MNHTPLDSIFDIIKQASPQVTVAAIAKPSSLTSGGGLAMDKTISKKDEKILANIRADKDIARHAEFDSFAQDLWKSGKRYLKAVRNQSHFCVIHSVSKSGMSRDLGFYQGGRGGVLNFYTLFDLLRPAGVKPAKHDQWRVQGCGMDMVFHTHYCLIHRLHSLGFISKKQCSELAQKSPASL